LEHRAVLFGPVFGAALFGYMLGATLLTGVSDKIGRKKVIVLGNVFFGLLTVASAFAPNLDVLLGLRFLAGLGLPNSSQGRQKKFGARRRRSNGPAVLRKAQRLVQMRLVE
jgi:hypothetical protein